MDVNITLEEIEERGKGVCLCSKCTAHSLTDCPKKQAECNHDMLECGYAEAQEKIEKLSARLEAAEKLIDALHSYAFATEDRRRSDIFALTTKIGTAREAWEALR